MQVPARSAYIFIKQSELPLELPVMNGTWNIRVI